jgi:hypothetical protein
MVSGPIHTDPLPPHVEQVTLLLVGLSCPEDRAHFRQLYAPVGLQMPSPLQWAHFLTSPIDCIYMRVSLASLDFAFYHNSGETKRPTLRSAFQSQQNPFS